jgi:hypothetical protein
VGLKLEKFFSLASLLFAWGCYKNHLYVQQEWVNRDFLASVKVGTPDPRQADPPQGQRLLIAWDFPKSLFERRLTLLTTVRLWDQSETVITRPVERKRDGVALFFPSKNLQKQILTYRIQVFDQEGGLIETWKHHFWTELIPLQ